MNIDQPKRLLIDGQECLINQTRTDYWKIFLVKHPECPIAGSFNREDALARAEYVIKGLKDGSLDPPDSKVRCYTWNPFRGDATFSKLTKPSACRSEKA